MATRVSSRTKKSRTFVESLESRFMLAVNYSSPIVITKGGTYTGNWESTDANVPAVEIRTSEAVIIENSNVRSKSDGIRNRWGANNLTVRNTNGYGVNPNISGRSPGRFIDCQFFSNVVVENCYLESTSGIYLYDYQGNGSSSQTVRVRYNTAKNIDGRKSNGSGGWQTAINNVQFLQLNDVHNIANAEIAWNQITNEPGKSAVTDNISLHLSDGTSASPIKVHDNFINGAYGLNPASDQYAGGGIMLADGSTSNTAEIGGYIKAYNNVILSTSNYGMAIASGHDIEVYGNRLFSSGYLADGTKIKPLDAGIYVRNYLNYSTFKNNTVHDNTAGWYRNNAARWDYDLGAATSSGTFSNTAVSSAVNASTYQNEFSAWQTKFAAATGQSPATPNPAQSPWGGTPITLPTRLEAENFDGGGEGNAYHDTTSNNEGGTYRTGEGVDTEANTDSGVAGFSVGWVKPGEWLEYTFNVSSATTQDLNFRVSSDGQGGTFHANIDGANVTGTMTVPDTGSWQTFTTIKKTGVALTPGDHILRIAMDTAGDTTSIGNFNYWGFSTAGAPAPSIPSAPSNATATANGSNSVTVKWNDNSSTESGYKIERALNSSFNSGLTSFTIAANTTSYTDTSAASNTQYYYRVRAYNAGGDSANSSTVSAKTGVASPAATAVTSLILVNADTNQDIATITAGSTVALSSLPTRNLNIRANVAGVVESVKFVLDGKSYLENAAPYYLTGDIDGAPRAWTPSVGSHTLTATAFSQDNAAGTVGGGLSLSFKIV